MSKWKCMYILLNYNYIVNIYLKETCLASINSILIMGSNKYLSYFYLLHKS